LSYKYEVRVDGELSVDPSYIIHYRVTNGDGRLLGDGIVQYHRLAGENDIPVNENLPPDAVREVRKRVVEKVTDYINQRR